MEAEEACSSEATMAEEATEDVVEAEVVLGKAEGEVAEVGGVGKQSMTCQRNQSRLRCKDVVR